MVRDGAQGPGAIEMVKRRVPTRMERQRTGPAAWLIVPRRPLADERTGEPRASRAVTEPEARYRYHDYCTPTQGATVPCPEPAVEALARGSNAGAGMESSFKRGKGAGGMDAYQGRTWHGWHPHMTLALLAVWFLPGATHRGQ